ncbi:MAG: nuclear transport factor 2 family protein [Pyrinomonadaceae bacterium]
MKSCPTCNQTFTDPNLSFCIDDGTPLVSVAAPEDEVTVVSPSGRHETVPPPTEVYKPRDWQAPDYQPPGFQHATAAPPSKKKWPWVVGLLALLVIGVIGIGIAGAILVPKMMRAASNRNSNSNVRRSGEANSNRGSNAPVSPAENTGTPVVDDDATPPPTDKDVVLAALTDLEHEWTAANINADKQKLNRILADDYVGISGGKNQGKAEYLRTIERDTTIQKWDFEDLKVNLMGDRATLDGVLRLQLSDQEAAFRFTDKFVWRGGRWQAVGSDVSRIK